MSQRLECVFPEPCVDIGRLSNILTYSVKSSLCKAYLIRKGKGLISFRTHLIPDWQLSSVLKVYNTSVHFLLGCPPTIYLWLCVFLMGRQEYSLYLMGTIFRHEFCYAASHVLSWCVFKNQDGIVLHCSTLKNKIWLGTLINTNLEWFLSPIWIHLSLTVTDPFQFLLPPLLL